MDLSLTESQKMLKSAARDFAKQECPWTAMKQIDESETGFSRELWGKVAGLGWLGMIFPEAYGGMGANLTDIAVIYEEMGQTLLPGVFFSSAMLCGSIILEAGTEQQKAQILPAIAQGKTILAMALTEPDYGWGPESIHLTASPIGDRFILNGTKRFVHDAQVADQIICIARTRETDDLSTGVTLFRVDKKTTGLSCRTLSGYTGEKLSELSFNAVEVPASSIIGEKDNGWRALAKALDRATVVLCAYMVGGCQRLLDMTAAYARTRVQFGQPIAAFQWVQGYIIDQANYLERARWFTYEALWKLDANKPERERNEAVSLAKAVTSEAFHESAHLGHEVHAGVGVDKKYPLYLYSKKAKTLYSYLGDPYHHRKRVAWLLGL
ncbi:MAG: acyl-CoA/acyl-ACP dehydrogenase [Chloroflexi bacterium]|nr:acyl-CoA/acyl-ACP dehydrogenase [Chloroflexota bacterium]